MSCARHFSRFLAMGFVVLLLTVVTGCPAPTPTAGKGGTATAPTSKGSTETPTKGPDHVPGM